MDYEVKNVNNNEEDVMELNPEEFKDRLYESINNDLEEMVQPVLLMKKALPEESIIKDGNLEMLHTSPIISSSLLMLNNVTKRLSDTEFTEGLGSSGASTLSYNQMEIATNEFTNYLIQNTLISFCNMLDNTGENFKSMVMNTRIKTMIAEELNREEYDVASIRGLVLRYVNRTCNNSYVSAFSNNDKFLSENNQDIATVFNNLMEFNSQYASQLEQVIFFKLCRACDRAISEVLLGTRVSPNMKYVVDAGVKYFALNNFKNPVDARYEVYYRLNNTLVNMINKFMMAVVVPMCSLVINKLSYLSYYYIYEVIYRENMEKEHQARKAKREQEKINEKFPF